jgi:stringent starvation protein B
VDETPDSKVLPLQAPRSDGKPPDKKTRLLGALDRGMTMIHLDARRPGVVVPDHLKGEPHVLLNLSYKFVPRDLAVSEWGVRQTLTFSGVPFCVAVPWSALYAISCHATKEFYIYPDDMPPELLTTQAQRLTLEEPAEEGSARAVLREVVLDQPQESDTPKEPPKRGHLRLVK